MLRDNIVIGIAFTAVLTIAFGVLILIEMLL
jgi:hypothetical protein